MALQVAEEKRRDDPPASSVPSITLPKGGGAIRGLGEKFAANPVTGTGSMSVPLATSPGRSGFGPQLALSYDSAAGSGAFGFGWSLSLPSITRKADKGLPQYRDAEESDEFLLSGAEDLVPVLKPDGSRWEDKVTAPGYTIHRYRPRIEGLFARIERWTRDADGDVHWRSISKDNVLTLYGKDVGSRIADPTQPQRVYSWLICETRDDRGNAVVYGYRAEDGEGLDLTRAHERHRGPRDSPSRTANRLLKRIRYGNRTPLLDDEGRRPRFLTEAQIDGMHWLFEVILDYGEHDADDPRPGDAGVWACRSDPFSTYRAGFEVRAYRLCRRVLMFHHFPDEPGVGQDCLVRSTTLGYRETPGASFLVSATQRGHRRKPEGGYVTRAMPPLEFDYTQAVMGHDVLDLEAGSLDDLPSGVEGGGAQWVDLDGEGLQGVLIDQGNGWFYKRNESPLGRDAATPRARLAPAVQLAQVPAGARLRDGRWQFLDLAGDGRQDLVGFDGGGSGFYERADAGWETFRAFRSSPRLDWKSPNVKFVDLTGDGHADVLVLEDQAFAWHPSLAEEGFGPAARVGVALDEEKGPRVVFADGTQTVFLADLSGDGLTDIVRIRNGEVCYWPNLGYGRFGPKVTMDDAPWFDTPDQFDAQRIRLADVDGSGVTDIIYLGRGTTRVWFNQAGNGWSEPYELAGFPPVDNVASVAALDLLGDGTACLVWSSSLPGSARASVKYLPLMKEGKPHLLVGSRNNLGAETRVRYAPSTYFYLKDEHEGRPWITRLPFPVHVVERVETYDWISRNRFVTRYAYHHGYFDGVEREFRGFGMVEQFDTEQMAALVESDALPVGDNVDPASHVPPVLTKTWYHTGAYVGRAHVSNFFAGLLDADDQGEYYREPGRSDAEARALLLADTVLPEGLSVEDEREACRALKGSMLRQEVYALDGTAKEPHPYTVVEQNFTIRRLQERREGRHSVFFTHPREALTYHYERDPADPRVAHILTLDVDEFGNVLKEVSVGYGRRAPDPELLPADQLKQAQLLMTYTDRRVTNAIDNVVGHPHDYRAPVTCDTRTYEITGLVPDPNIERFRIEEFIENGFSTLEDLHEVPYEQPPMYPMRQKRLIEHSRVLFRPDDIGASVDDPLRLLPLGTMDTKALPGESYKLAFTSGLLAKVFRREGQPLLANAADVLEGGGAERGGYVSSQLIAAGTFPLGDPDDQWWAPGGRSFLSPDANASAAEELVRARGHFFLASRYRDPFHTEALSTEHVVEYDMYDLLMVEKRDPVGNVLTVGERLANGARDPAKPGNDYRILQAWCITDPNGNRTQVAFDALGMVVGTAVMGKPPPAPAEGDSLDGFVADLPEEVVLDHMANPLADPHAILRKATTRVVYDLFSYKRSLDAGVTPQPAAVYTLARETHEASIAPTQLTEIQHSFSYSDGFGREVQRKSQAEPGAVVPNGPVLNPRWVGSGWTVFNNKDKPVRQHEPFFSGTRQFEFGIARGVSPILFYDPMGRPVATLHPNHTYEKTVFEAWREATYDVNDTAAARGSETGDPRTDPHIKGYVEAYFAAQPGDWQTWRAPRQLGNLGPVEQDAAEKAAVHADTPTVAYLDTLGRPTLTLAQNRFEGEGAIVEETFLGRVELDIEGHQRMVRDAVVQAGDPLGRIAAQYDYDMMSNRIHEASIDRGERWTLADIGGNPLRTWNSRGQPARTTFDPLRRLVRTYVRGADKDAPMRELLTERLIYGEQHPEGKLRNLLGALFLHLDQAGAVSIEAKDFRGNETEFTRRFAKDYHVPLDWRTADDDHMALPPIATAQFNPGLLEDAIGPFLESEIFTGRRAYDALNRPVSITTPSTAAMRPSVVRLCYNEANFIERVDVNVRSATNLGQPLWTPFVTNIEYNAKGQRERIDYGNGVSTSYGYDPLTFRLVQLFSRRNALAFPGDCPRPPGAGWPGCLLQNLRYTYDPAGNVVHIADDAQQAIFFRNKRVEPSAEYTYDALYRLMKATGREHLGQAAGAPTPHTAHDASRTRVPWSANDGNALGNYTEHYVYDAVGNLLEMRHRGDDPANPGWSRTYTYADTSPLEDGSNGPAKTSNRLTRTDVGTSIERYVHDAHGNIIRLPHLGGQHPTPNILWDYRDQIRQVEMSDERSTFHAYDSARQRVRLVIEKSPGLREERLYLGGFEIYRRRNARNEVTLERETLQVMDQSKTIALVETRTLDIAGDDPAPEILTRYQVENHLGSVSLELDDSASIISYEEYTPYGSTAYQAVRSQTETPKRYRYTGKERDEDTGLYYHGARHYAPWLGRWASADPTGLSAGLNLFEYARGNPVRLSDENGKDPTPDQTRFRQIFDERRQADATSAHARTLIEAFRDTGISGGTAQERFSSVMRLTGGSAEAPSRNFDPFTIRQIGTGVPPSRTCSASAPARVGDTGFRRELRDSVHYGRDVEMHRQSSDQIGHFLTAASFGYSLRQREKFIERRHEEAARFRREHPYLSVARELLDNTVDLQVQFAFEGEQYRRAMVGHELIADRALSGEGITSTLASPFMASPEDVQHFLQGRLDLIQVDDSQRGNSYQDLLLTWVGYKFGEHMANGFFASKEEAARWLEMMLTEQNLEAVQSGDPFYGDAQQMQGMLQQFRQIQQRIHPVQQVAPR